MPRPATRADVIAAVADLAARHGDRTVFVGIDGFGGSGKTTLAAAVAAAVRPVTIVAVDDLQGVGIAEWDWGRLQRQLVQPLLAVTEAQYDLVRWGESEPYGQAVVAPGSVVVLEGVSATRREAEIPWDLTVWVDADEPTRRRRTLARDGAAMQPLWQQWIRTEQAYAAQQRPWERVDLVVAGGSGLGE